MIDDNKDIIEYIDFINNEKIGTKRKKNKLTYDDAIINFKILAIDRLIKLDKKFLNLKGNKLKLFIDNLINIFKQVIYNFKNNKIFIKKLDKTTILYIIAELSICIYYLNSIKQTINNNKITSFSDFLKKFKNSFVKKTFKKHKIDSDNFSIHIESDDDKNILECINDECDNDNDCDNDNYYDYNNYENEDDEENDYDNDYEDDVNNNNDYDIIKSIYDNKSCNTEALILEYYENISFNEKNEIITNLNEINDYKSIEKPLIFKILELPLSIQQKNYITNTYRTLETNLYPDNKLKLWFESLMKIPFGKYKGGNFCLYNHIEINNFLINLENIMNQSVYGHTDAKRQIIQIMGQQIKNPKAKGNVIGLWGPPGTGKTSLIKNGIAKAMDKPFIFISLGGASDASFLEGHSYTYEGSIYGRIVNGLISSECMNPIIYFDELDKISKTYKGDEITNILIHLTDPVQNSHFRDKYFHGIDIDLSQVTFIFSFNDPHNINPILLDRITTIETKYLMLSQKIHIVSNYLLPEILKDINYNMNDINISNDIIKFLVKNYTNEGGVRKLKSLLYTIIREINIKILTDLTIQKPFYINENNIRDFLSNSYEYKPIMINNEPKIGIVYGLYAGSSGIGGVLPIQAILIPSQTALSLKATGNLEKVIKESTEVACSLAWSCIDSELKEKYLLEWKDKPLGFHIHCPDGAVPKDGPSAGAALTLVLYSLLTNKKINNYIAMTGEINLEGKITAIGGLEEKLEGAKKSGIKKVLVPKENEKDLIKIKNRNESLIDINFSVKFIENINDVLREALL